MALRCGLVGLPNAGKSTIFNALSGAGAEVGNFPFCTIEPNICLVSVPDPRLDVLATTFSSQKKIASVIEFVDIAGLVEGSSKGEGMGNQFLAQIREATVIVHVLRCFEDVDVSHIKGSVNPLRDLDTIQTELILADLESVERRLIKRKKTMQSKERHFLEKVRTHLEEGTPLQSVSLSDEEQTHVHNFLTAKPQLYICNVSEDPSETELDRVRAVSDVVGEPSKIICISGKVESDIATLDSEEEKKLFLEELRSTESGLHTFIRSAHDILGLSTFFTAGPTEARAWSFTNGATAQELAGTIHTDFQKGFICAEIYHYQDLLQYKSEKGIKDAGKMRREGRRYSVRDGDVIFFRWNL